MLPLSQETLRQILIAAGALLFLFGVILRFQTLRYMSRRRAVAFAALGTLIGCLGFSLAIGAWGSMIFDRAGVMNFLVFFVPLSFFFGVLHGVAEYRQKNQMDSFIKAGTLTRRQAYPYDRSLRD